MQELFNNLETAIKAVIDSGSLGIDTYTGQDGHDRARPFAVIYAQNGEERPVGLGNYMVTVAVQVRSDVGNSSLEEHRQRCHDVFALVNVDNIGEILSGLGDLTVRDPVINVSGSHGREDDDWTTEHKFDCFCCLSDIA